MVWGGISPRQQNGKDGGPRLAKKQLAQRPEHREGENAYVDAGYDEDVIGAGALEFRLDVAPEEGAPSDEHGLHQRAPFAGPELHDVRQYAATRTAPPQTDAAAHETRQNLHAAGTGGTGQANALGGEIAGHIHRTGIAIIARHSQLGDEMQTLTIGVHAKR